MFRENLVYSSSFQVIPDIVLSLSLMSINARGLKHFEKRKALFLFAKKKKTDLCFFQECHSTANYCNFWRSQWGDNICLAHGSEHSAGVGIYR